MEKKQELELWTSLNAKSRTIENKMDSLERKRTGSYYTDLQLTDVMMEELVQNLKQGKKRLIEYSFFEPCVGAGNFVFSYIKAIKETGISKPDAIILLNNIYVSDINEDAIKGYAESLRTLALLYWNIELTEEYFKSHTGTGLLVDVTANVLEYIGLETVFPEQASNGGFDIVATNPPYKNLKAERNQYASEEEYEKDKDKYSEISKIVSSRFLYSTSGVLNLYKLFVEEIIDKYASDKAYVSLLIPSSIMSDKTCQKLRTHMLMDEKVLSVKVISEGSQYIDAQQALSAILLQKGKMTDVIDITKDYCEKPNDIARVSIKDIINENTGNAILAVSEEEYQVLKKLRNFPVIKELDFIANLRGELDLTTNKKNIVQADTGYRLLRGRDIGYYKLLPNGSDDFVLGDFVNTTKKKIYIEHERIICQQIANMNKERRVTFSYVPAGNVLGNSCNFISVSTNKYGIDIFALLGLLNTKIINWLFKLTSSNNHVNNYEIDCFPIPIGAKEELLRISSLVRGYLDTDDTVILDEIERLAENAYGLNNELGDDEMEDNTYINEYLSAIQNILPGIDKETAKQILFGEVKIDAFCEGLNKFYFNVVSGITSKYVALFNGYLLNHTTFKLSDLDLEMIKYVPQGGSWKDIPMETVEKSKRLKRITETGGRTTLYGRIDYEKPSYTITTYFNRPGNGTYVHPIHERVLSVREAARFQAFRDDYYFFGNKTQQLKQVGNAVPTLLAYQIGKKIKDVTGCSKSIDLFCGAGGMTAGFKAAGISSLMSNDIEESACTTLKINNPEIDVLCGDITQEETKAKLVKAAHEGGADLICGGPPCQGFSMAGFRAEDDPRNQLFREFVNIVKRVNPKVIVFENVEGLLSYQGGKTYREVHALFSELGYNTEGRTLLASEYAVPQRRKRVIIICTRQDLGVYPSELFPKPITINGNQVTARDTISDLENVECGNNARYSETNESEILKFFKGTISYDEYISKMTSDDKEVAGLEEEPKYDQLSLLDLL
ncbi:Alw26I/Eco31I/Esp3I family type II restriction adenine-specific DNA-methyltransferase [Lachnospira pectinoschiza]|uniref:Alw26I/Eco31I/Esp3I family type II restriction adenine-specific DNA-methyltransferase n=1 Tax=Lachnospira pectinoschiza TaxID=28052 RepID=UPI001D095DAF|nr:Alw26I/Eco31I/Esp3I family type II restriction adenine-specific DNA-methyltransferase [Lachnospira pectinoschiza]MCB6142533.1 Alw26I/Eco31I/Esp3I family type II restriction adenine-specific DNA-methyltransferase [Lachnospira pectinoschiza]